MSEKKIKFTVIDALIILIAIAVIAVGVIKFAPSLFIKTEKSAVEFTVLVAEKDISFADAITVGGRVTLSLTEKDGGVVKNVEAKVAEKLAFNSIDGSYSIQKIEDKRDVYVTVVADVKESDLAVKTGGTEIRVGEKIPVRGKGYATEGYIIEVNEIEEGQLK